MKRLTPNAIQPSAPACHSARTLDGLRQRYCSHPRVHARGQLVTAEMCRACRLRTQPPPQTFRPFPPRRTGHAGELCFYLGEQSGFTDCATCRGAVRLKTFHCRHPLHGEITLRDCERCADFEPLQGRGFVKRWAVGVTTAPRKEPTIGRSLRSIVSAGWKDIHVFAEPGSPIPTGIVGLTVTRRGETLGVLGNWFLGLSELLHRDPDADAYALFQDDVVLARNVRQYLETTLWPAERAGLVSVYCPEPYANGGPGFREVSTGGGLLGALSYILPSAAAKWIVTAGTATWFRRRTFSRESRRLDVLIGQLLAQAGWSAFYVSPSLAHHVGEHSTLWPGIGASRKRRAGDFVGEHYDALRLLGGSSEHAGITGSQSTLV